MLLGAALGLGPASARADHMSVEGLQEGRANPLSGLRNITLEYQADVDTPPDGNVASAWTLQAVWPVPLPADWSLIAYPNVPVLSQPDGDGGTATGLGDTVLTAVATPNRLGVLVWGAGAVLQIPTATRRELGSSRWAAGPALAVFVQPDPLTVGALVQNGWSFAGGGGSHVNVFETQYFLTWNLPDGWFLQSAGTIAADWEAAPSQRWTVPVGGGFGRVFAVGAESVSVGVQTFYDAIRPDAAAPWSALGSVQLLLP